jgi:hypothetical protein
MATKRIPRPRDPIALAKLIGDIATGQFVDQAPPVKRRASRPLTQKAAKQPGPKRNSP